MAGTVKVNSVQLGDSVTATQNFTIQTNVDGSGKLARGNAGGTTQDIITWDANGRVFTPQTSVVFRAKVTTQFSIASGTATKVQLNSKDFDSNNFFDAVTNYRFQPTIAGYYHFDYSLQAIPSGAFLQYAIAVIYKNGAIANGDTSDTGYHGSYLYLPAAPYNEATTTGSDTVFLNGSTDYVELWTRCGTSNASAIPIPRAKFTGYLVRAT